MLTLEEFKAILNRIRAGSKTEADESISRRSLEQSGKVVQIEQISGGEIHIGDVIHQEQKAKREQTERDFLRMVKAEVVDSLKQSLHHAVLMNLGKEEQPEQVERLWDAKIKVADQPNVLLPNETKTIEVFDREDIAGRLLILGNPGSGKTTTLLELAKALIERAETEQDFPMPVLFNLSSWKDGKQPLHEWMVQELKLRGVPSDVTPKWLNKHKLLPLLDGLDEMASDRQETCVKAINQQLLTGEKSLTHLVVCSRNEEYDNYETRLLLNGAISIQALTIEKIQSYLNSIDQPELCHTLDHDPELLALVRTPLFLSIAALSFRELSQERWQTLTSTEARIEYLLDNYTRQMLERSIPRNMFGKWQLPSDQKTRKWLIWLAQQMQRESEFEFLIEKMQPSLLPTSSKLRMYKLLTGLTSGIIFGSIFFYMFDGFGRFYGTSYELPVGTKILYILRDGVLFAIASGLACGVSSVMRPFETRRVKIEVRHKAISGLIFGAIFSLYFWLYHSFSLTNVDELSIVSGAVLLGLAVGMISTLIEGLAAKITAVESLQWSWEKAKNRFIAEMKCNLKTWLIVILVVGLICTLTIVIIMTIKSAANLEPLLVKFSLSERIWILTSVLTKSVFNSVLLHFFIFVLDLFIFIISIELQLFALIFFVRLIIATVVSTTSGLKGRDIECKSIPNQGIKRSLANSITLGLIGGLIYLAISGLRFLPLVSWLNDKSGIVKVSTSIALVVLSFGVPRFVRLYGGAACIQHCVLRLILHCSGYIPWNYAQFLNYCTERSLLQRVGGRYRFIHRLLQEHFAAMPFDGIEGDRQRSTL